MAKSSALNMVKPYHYVIDLTDDDEDILWRSTNDGVMGGKSKGQIVINNGICMFTGNLSIENNGGFSSIYRNLEPLPVGLDTIEICVAGDGLVYQLRVIVYINGYRLAYKYDFQTTEGEKSRVCIKLNDFKATFRGRSITDAPQLTSEQIRQIGFLVTNKAPVAFSLSLFQVDIYRQYEV
ncbi:CIA30 family protein [Thalassotalea atypica]|uniref:CIA30 family protein n=1 Tax=Thalassotalea atypica TaxID=2054316 RepID=UPI0025728FB3|nr:CIA30 family protein [Thalassotalea atypica]